MKNAKVASLRSPVAKFMNKVNTASVEPSKRREMQEAIELQEMNYLLFEADISPDKQGFELGIEEE